MSVLKSVIARRLGKLLPSTRWIKKVERYYQLKKKGDNRTPNTSRLSIKRS